MKTNYFMYYRYWTVIPLIGIFFLGVNAIHEVPIASIVFFGFFYLIDIWLWKYPPFSWMFTIEDFSGTYDGYQIGYRISPETHREVEEKLYIRMIIKQTGSSIRICSFYRDAGRLESSKSESRLISMGESKYREQYEIVFHYHNKGNEQWNGHYGTTVMTILKKFDGFHISGIYYTNRKPQTLGKFQSLKRKSKSKKHPF